MRIQATPKYPLGIAEPESGVHRALIGQRGLENYPITNFEGPNGYYLRVKRRFHPKSEARGQLKQP